MTILRRLRELLLIAPFLYSALGCDFLHGERPSLIVLVTVDQLRGDLLERYDAFFSGGFRRLLDEGHRFTGATHDHAKTATAAGHATLGTGAFPSRNGIVANEWLERASDGWRSVYCMEDTLTHILGFPTLDGRSPRNILTPGLADWVMAEDTSAVVVSISRKDRAAIGMAATAPGHVYWITENQGQFVTSSHYASAYPGWVERFNRDEMPRIFGDSIWDQTLTVEARDRTRRDTVRYEGDGEHTFFPHRFMDEASDPTRPGALERWAYSQIHPDAAVAAFAKVAVTELALGQDGITDYLALSFSQTDAIGHDYGPFSREQLENLVHLDRLLGDLMDHLDQAVGDGRWTMALTGDHGAMAIPEYLVEQGRVGARPGAQDLASLRGIFESHRAQNGDPIEVANALMADLEALPFVADAFSVAEMSSGPPADSFTVLFRNSFHPDRWHWGYRSQGSGILFRFVEGLYPSSTPRGTGHGSPYYYDRHVPLIFFGSGVQGGVAEGTARTVDVAPTLAHLGGISVPSEIDGMTLFR